MADSKLKNTEVVKHKAISGRMSDYFLFKLCDDGTVYSAENVFCMICHKSFAYHGLNTALVYHLQRAHPVQHKQLLDKAPPKKSSVPLSTQQIGHFFNRNDCVVSDKVQQDISKSLAQWIATAGRPISIVEDAGLQETLHIALQNDRYTLPGRRLLMVRCDRCTTTSLQI